MPPTPKTQNPILRIYRATKFQDSSRLLRLAELVWKISVVFVERSPKHRPGHANTWCVFILFKCCIFCKTREIMILFVHKHLFFNI